MSFTISLPEGNYAVLLTCHKDFDPFIHGPLIDVDLPPILSELKSPVYFVADLLDVALTFDQIVKGINHTTRQSTLERPPTQWDNVKQLIFVTKDPVIITATDQMRNSKIFNNADILAFPTVEAALDFCRNNQSGPL